MCPNIVIVIFFCCCAYEPMYVFLTSTKVSIEVYAFYRDQIREYVQVLISFLQSYSTKKQEGTHTYFYTCAW